MGSASACGSAGCKRPNESADDEEPVGAGTVWSVHSGLPVSRRSLALVGTALVLATVILGWKIGPSAYPTRPDSWAWRLAVSPRVWRPLDALTLGHGKDVVDDLAPIATPGTGFALSVGLGLTFSWLHRTRDAVFAVAGPISALILTEWLFKPLFGRTLRGDLAYPSGHTTATLAAATVLTLLTWKRWGPSRAALVVSLYTAVVVVLALYLLSRREHYPTDMVGGFGIGVGIPCIVAALTLDARDLRPATQDSGQHL